METEGSQRPNNCDSEGYKDKPSCEAAIASVKKTAPTAKTVEAK